MLRTLISLPRQSEDTENLFVLALRVYDVSKRAHKQRGEGEALRAVALICSRELRLA